MLHKRRIIIIRTRKSKTFFSFTNNKIKIYLGGVTKRIPPEDIEKVRDILRAFRLELENIVEVFV